MSEYSIKDVINAVQELQSEEVIKLSFSSTAKAKSFRAMLYKEKRSTPEVLLAISIKGSVLIVSKEKEKEKAFTFEIVKKEDIFFEEEEEKEEEDPLNKVQTINIDPEKIKTIRQALSKYDGEKSEIVLGFSEEKTKVLEDQNLSEQEKEEKIKNLLQTANIKIENFNRLAKQESLKFSK